MQIHDNKSRKLANFLLAKFNVVTMNTVKKDTVLSCSVVRVGRGQRQYPFARFLWGRKGRGEKASLKQYFRHPFLFFCVTNSSL